MHATSDLGGCRKCWYKATLGRFSGWPGGLHFGNAVAAILLARGCVAMLDRRVLKFAVICLSCWAAMRACAGRAQPAVDQKFNGPEKTWQLMSGPAPAQILAQELAPGGVGDSTRFERVVVAAPVGQSAFLVCPIARVAVLEELQVRLWVNASRPDVQLAVRVVLPRSMDAQKKAVATAIVRGSVYSRPGNWQELRVADVPRLLADQVRVMRANPGASIDSHEAYVDAIILLVPGNPSGTALERII